MTGPGIKLATNKPKKVRLYERSATVQNVLRDAITNNQFTKVVVIGQDKEGHLFLSHSNMKRLEAVGMAEYAKAAIMAKVLES